MHHAIPFYKFTEGFGDLLKDAGERAHQQESRNDLRVAAVKGLIKKEICKSQFDSMSKSSKVQEAITLLHAKAKKKSKKASVASKIVNDLVDYKAIYHSAQESNKLILLTEIKRNGY